MPSSTESDREPDASPAEQPINWMGVAAVYAGVVLGIAWMVYWGDVRNAAWLVLIGAGGGCTLYGRLLHRRGEEEAAGTWKVVGAAFYLVLLAWAGWVLLQ
jgi:hypothetical protein